MTTKCLFRGGPADGRMIEIENGIKQVVIPGTDGHQLLSNQYERGGIALFEFVKSIKIPDSASKGNLDYVFGLQDRIKALEAEIAGQKLAIEYVGSDLETAARKIREMEAENAAMREALESGVMLVRRFDVVIGAAFTETSQGVKAYETVGALRVWAGVSGKATTALSPVRWEGLGGTALSPPTGKVLDAEILDRQHAVGFRDAFALIKERGQVVVERDLLETCIFLLKGEPQIDVDVAKATIRRVAALLKEDHEQA